jgi:SAM-dependent methyltransferase
MTPAEELNKADDLFGNNKFDEAAKIYAKHRSQPLFAPFCNYRLASISNVTGDPLTAYNLYYEAFQAKPDLALFLYGNDHPNQGYVFKGKKPEVERDSCPLCGNSDIRPKWCYPLSEAIGYNSHFNPVRLWMHCPLCHHIFARHFPKDLFLYNDNPRTPRTVFFSYYSNVFDRIARYTQGSTLFEIGIGACECLLAAREIGLDAFGIDVIDKHVQMARERFGLNAQTADFIEYQSDKKFDIIIMGDVLEHVSDPVLAVNKAHDLLDDDGALWISTPNFESAFSIVEGHNDPMRLQQYHLNYFSRRSLFTLLEKCGFASVDYSISNHYNGSMEIIAVKSRRLGIGEDCGEQQGLGQ